MSNHSKTKGQLTPDLKASRQFLEFLTGERDPAVTFQVFDDTAQRPELAGHRHGRLSDPAIRDWLLGRNKQGCGVYVTVNATDGKGRSRRNVVTARAVWNDFDGTPRPAAFQIEPGCVTETSPGRFQTFVRIEPTTDLNAASDAQARLAAYYGTDRTITDPARVCRLPGFLHNKREPFRSRIVALNEFESPVTLEEVATAHPCEYRRPSERRDEGRAEEPEAGFDNPIDVARAREFLEDAPPSIEGEGGNRNAYNIACELNDMGISPDLSLELMTADDGWNSRCEPEWSSEELETIIANAARYKVGSAGQKSAAEPLFDEPIDAGAYDDAPEKPKGKITPTRFEWIEPSAIPCRQWLYKPCFIRKYIGLTVATGGAGKSSLLLAELMACVSGRALLGVSPVGQLRCWYWNGEDPFEELQRRIAATIKHHGVTKAEMGDRFYYDSGRDLPIKIATLDGGTVKIARPLVKAMVEAIREHRIDVLVIDPFVSSHNVTENDNNAIEQVAKEWARIADATNSHIHLVHHTRKTGKGEAASISDSRGASALSSAARVRRALNTMTEADATAAAIPEELRSLYVSADLAGSSMTRPAESLDWFKLESVNLGNGPDDDPEGGDEVGAITAWKHPGVVPLVVTDEQAEEILADLRLGCITDKKTGERGGPWRADMRSPDWAGFSILKSLGLDPNKKGVKKSAGALIAKMVEDGELVEFEGYDAKRMPKQFLRVAD